MKKITSKYKSYDLPLVTLFIEDIATISEMLLKVCSKIKIIVSDYELESAEEMEQIKEPRGYIKEIKIEGYDEKAYPVVDLSLGQFPRLVFYSISDELKTKGLAKNIEEFLTAKKSLWRSFLNSNYFIAIYVLAFIVIYYTVPKNMVMRIILIIFLLGVGITSLLHRTRYSLIYLCEKKDRPNFFPEIKTT